MIFFNCTGFTFLKDLSILGNLPIIFHVYLLPKMGNYKDSLSRFQLPNLDFGGWFS